MLEWVEGCVGTRFGLGLFGFFREGGGGVKDSGKRKKNCIMLCFVTVCYKYKKATRWRWGDLYHFPFSKPVLSYIVIVIFFWMSHVLIIQM